MTCFSLPCGRLALRTHLRWSWRVTKGVNVHSTHADAAYSSPGLPRPYVLSTQSHSPIQSADFKSVRTTTNKRLCGWHKRSALKSWSSHVWPASQVRLGTRNWPRSALNSPPTCSSMPVGCSLQRHRHVASICKSIPMQILMEVTSNRSCFAVCDQDSMTSSQRFEAAAVQQRSCTPKVGRGTKSTDTQSASEDKEHKYQSRTSHTSTTALKSPCNPSLISLLTSIPLTPKQADPAKPARPHGKNSNSIYDFATLESAATLAICTVVVLGGLGGSLLGGGRGRHDIRGAHVFIERLALGGGLDDASTNDVVAKRLALDAVLRIHGHELVHDLEDLLLVDRLAVDLGQTRAVVRASERHDVLTGRLAHKARLGHPRTRTAVGTARHAEHRVARAQPVGLKDRLHLVHEQRQVALRLGHRQTARRERHTGARAQLDTRVLPVVHLVLAQMRIDRVLVLGRNVRHDNVLVGRQPERALVDLAQLAQTRAERRTRLVLDTSVLEPQRAVVVALVVLRPAVQIRVGLKLVRARLGELVAQTTLHLGLEVVGAAPVLVDRVLETRLLAVRTVARVALDEHHGAARVERLLGRHKADHAAQTRLGEVRVGRAHDVSVDVTARGDGVEHRLVDTLHGRLEVALDDAVVLDGLARGDLDRLVAVLFGDVVELHPLLGRHHTTGDARADHEAVRRLETGGLALLERVAVVLHVGAVELGELAVGLGDGAGRLVLERLLDGAAEVVGGDLHVLVGDRLGLGLLDLDRVDAERLPEQRLPDLVAGLVAVGVLVVAETDGRHARGAELLEAHVDVLSWLVVVVRVLGSRPVVAVTHGEDGVVDRVGKGGDGHGVERLVGEAAVLGRLTLTGGGGEEDDVLLVLELLGDGVVVHGEQTSGHTTRLGTRGELLGDLLSVAAVRGDEDEQGRAVEGAEHLVVGLLGLAALELAERVALRSGNVVGELGARVDERGEEVLAVEELLELLAQTHAVEAEDVGAASLCAGVPAEERPVARVDGELGLAQHVERGRILGAVGDVGEHDRRAVELVGLHERVEDLGVVGVDGGAGDVDVAVVHGVEGDVLLALVSRLCVSLGVGDAVKDEHVDVAAGSDDVVDTTHAGVVGPGVAADDPSALEGEVGGERLDLVERSGRGGRLEERGDLLGGDAAVAEDVVDGADELVALLELSENLTKGVLGGASGGVVVGVLVGRVDDGKAVGEDLLEHEVVGLLVLGHADGGGGCGSRWRGLCAGSELLEVTDDERVLWLGGLERLDELLCGLVAVLDVAERAADKDGGEGAVGALEGGGDVDKEGAKLGGPLDALLEHGDALDAGGDDVEQALGQRGADETHVEHGEVVVGGGVVLEYLGAGAKNDGEVVEAGLAGGGASVAVGAVGAVGVTVDAVGVCVAVELGRGVGAGGSGDRADEGSEVYVGDLLDVARDVLEEVEDGALLPRWRSWWRGGHGRGPVRRWRSGGG
ncbi:hypothetical protein L1887_55095 [Cichorium endivia]|nr:hypothetical protein L1887_55095 [Cichorium endivia]